MLFSTEILSPNEINKNYNPDRVYASVTPGSQIYGDMMYLDKENPGLRRMAQTLVHLVKTEDVNLDTLLKNSEYKDPEISADIKLLASEVDKMIKLAKDRDITPDKLEGYKELQNRLSKYNLALTRLGTFVKFRKHILKLNSPFFKTASRTIPNSTLDFAIYDQDYDRWVNKTWLFTNVKNRKIRALDRNNRPFIVRYKDTTDSDVFNYLGIPPTAEGIFIIKDNVAGRSNFTNKIGYHRHMDGYSGLIPLTGPSNYIREKLNLSPSDDLNSDRFKNKLNEGQFSSYFNILDNNFLRGDYSNLQDPPPSLDLNIYMKQAVYPNMAESGADRAGISLMCRKDPNLIFKLNSWKELMEAYYYNTNMELDNRDAFKYMIRNYLLNVSDKLLMYPNNKDDCGLDKNDESILDRERFLYKMPNSSPNVSYRNLLKFGESIKNGYGLNHSSELYKVQEELDKFMTFRNALTFQDIIFIPINKLQMNNNTYYCSKSDYMFLMDRDISTTDVIHPFSVVATEVSEEENIGPRISTGVNIEVYSNSAFNRHQILYTKVFGEVIEIYVKPSDIIGESDYIKRSYRDHTGNTKTERFDYTEENLLKLGLYYTTSEAQYDGITPDKIDSYSLVNKIKLVEAQAEKERLKTQNEILDYRFNLLVHKQKEQASTLEYKRDLLKIQMDLKELLIDYKHMVTKAEIDGIKLEDKAEFSKTRNIIESIGSLAGVLKSGNDLFTAGLRIVNTIIDYKSKSKKEYYV